MHMILALLLFISTGLPSSVVAEVRIALVIGNGNYPSAPLQNPVNDARDISHTLKSLGFTVSTYIDADRRTMRQALREFGGQLKQADVGLFYYAGHGMQISGRNYLLPVQIDISSADEVEDESIAADAVLRKMQSAGNRLNIVILDACRNNPFARSFRGVELGLARMEGPVGTLIAYATAPGSVAADGDGQNGLYTQYLLQALRQPGLTIEQVFKKVRNGVRSATDGRQIPWESSSLTGEFFFLPMSRLATDPRPPQVKAGHLQIIANVPHATVIINNADRGRTDDRGVLNASDIVAGEADVMVQADGYAPTRQHVRLAAGQWRRLEVNLQPAEVLATLQKQGGKRQTAMQRSCLENRQALMAIQGEGGVNESVLSTLASAEAKKYGLKFITLSAAEQQLLQNNSLFTGNPDYSNLLHHYMVDYSLKITAVVRDAPIHALKTSMKTIYGDVSLELLALRSGKIIGTSSFSFREAGMDRQYVLQKHFRRHIDAAMSEITAQACAMQ